MRYITEALFALAHFLDGRNVRAVWAKMEREDVSFSGQRLILCTDLSLSATRILQAYGKRWSIEDMFNQLKNRWGWKEAWQQSRQVLHCCSQILAVGYASPQLLALRGEEQMQALAALAPWRAEQPITAGLVRLGLTRIFRDIDILGLWTSKSGKIGPQSHHHHADRAPDELNIAEFR